MNALKEPTWNIKAYFQYERGRWDSFKNEYTDRHFLPIIEKQIKIKLVHAEGKQLLSFIGGPTGFETYYLEDLMGHINSTGESFCICGGTINNWPRCWVGLEEFRAVLKEINILFSPSKTPISGCIDNLNQKTLKQ